MPDLHFQSSAASIVDCKNGEFGVYKIDADDDTKQIYKTYRMVEMEINVLTCAQKGQGSLAI